MTCPAMYGNGAQIGMMKSIIIKVPQRIQVGPLQAPHEYFGEVVGLIKRGLVLQQFVTMPGLTTAAKTLDFVLPDHF